MKKLNDEEVEIILDSEEYGLYHPYGYVEGFDNVLIEGRVGWFLVPVDMFKITEDEVTPKPALLLAIGGLAKIENQ